MHVVQANTDLGELVLFERAQTQLIVGILREQGASREELNKVWRPARANDMARQHDAFARTSLQGHTSVFSDMAFGNAGSSRDRRTTAGLLAVSLGLFTRTMTQSEDKSPRR